MSYSAQGQTWEEIQDQTVFYLKELAGMRGVLHMCKDPVNEIETSNLIEQTIDVIVKQNIISEVVAKELQRLNDEETKRTIQQIKEDEGDTFYLFNKEYCEEVRLLLVNYKQQRNEIITSISKDDLSGKKILCITGHYLSPDVIGDISYRGFDFISEDTVLYTWGFLNSGLYLEEYSYTTNAYQIDLIHKTKKIYEHSYNIRIYRESLSVDSASDNFSKNRGNVADGRNCELIEVPNLLHKHIKNIKNEKLKELNREKPKNKI
jgi:hypothetical protein